ncbi:hypothetical protein [Arvimicrobium flavum]|uniref:hypothetical protein n=1 Tax=Arvimicrobium flavum TaxID=3393320 RepID=UPI00237BCB63|nr:hypothetical protein [Mesorhizobium shangrilense]
MNARNNDTKRTQQTPDLAIDRWENEGGAHRHESPDHHYGRRVETDRSWTVYHVFTGVPARINGNTMIGLTQRVATDGMLSLNRHNEPRRRSGGSPMADIRTAQRTSEECRR